MSNKLSIIICVLVFFFLIKKFWNLYEKSNELQTCGECVIGRLEKVHTTTIYYSYKINDKRFRSNNGVRLSTEKEGSLYPIIYSKNDLNNGYLVNNFFSKKMYSYGDSLPSSICDSLKRKVSFLHIQK
jgi:hypothetical protein